MYGDISNLEMCRKAVENIDCICHQATLGSVPRSVKDPLNSHLSNVNGFLNILIGLKKKELKELFTFIFVCLWRSSCITKSRRKYWKCPITISCYKSYR